MKKNYPFFTIWFKINTYDDFCIDEIRFMPNYFLFALCSTAVDENDYKPISISFDGK